MQEIDVCNVCMTSGQLAALRLAFVQRRIACTAEMRPIVTPVAWSVGVCVCFVTAVSPTKTDESIDMRFGIWTGVGRMMWSQFSSRNGGLLRK